MEGYWHSHNYEYGRVWADGETSSLFTCITNKSVLQEKNGPRSSMDTVTSYSLYF